MFWRNWSKWIFAVAMKVIVAAICFMVALVSCVYAQFNAPLLMSAVPSNSSPSVVSITFSPSGISFPDNTADGTQEATFTVNMSDGSVFQGTPTISSCSQSPCPLAIGGHTGAWTVVIANSGGPPWVDANGQSFVVAASTTAPPPIATFVANFANVHQTIDGFGGSDAFIGPGPIGEAAVYDELYCINGNDPGCAGTPGIGLTFLRQGMFGLSDPGNATAVVARGGKVWATPFALTVPTGQYQAAAQSMVNWISTQVSNGIPIYAATTQNEPDCGCNSGVIWDSSQTVAFIDVLGPMLHGMSPSVKLMSPESAGWSWIDGAPHGNYISAIEGDSAANAQTDIFSWHAYSGNPSSPNDGSRHVWQTEDAECGAPPCPWNPNIDQGVALATWVYDAIATFSANAWHFYWIWQPNTSNGDQVLTTDAQTPKRYFAFGNWSRYVRPGWVRIDVTGSLSGIYGVAAFKTSGHFAIIAINNSGADIPNVTFGISGISVSGSVTPYVTSGTAIGALGTDGNLSAGSASSGIPSSIPISGGVFTSTVPYGVTTFVQ